LRIDLINLDRSTSRLAEFTAVNRHLREVVRWSAVDGIMLDPAALVAQGLIGPTVPRYYSKRNLGGALSHIGLWERAINTGQPLTISEDDAIFHYNFEAYATAILGGLPRNCDIVLWGWNLDSLLQFAMLPGVSPCLCSFDQTAMRAGIASFQSLPLSPQPFRLLMTFGIMCYTIFPAGARALKQACVPLHAAMFSFPGFAHEIPNAAIDIAMASLYPRLSAFVCFPPIVLSKNEGKPWSPGFSTAAPQRSSR
jgi:glycosyl transferase, family 25